VTREVLSPSDLTGAGPQRVFVPNGETVRVGGRVTRSLKDGVEEISITDAFGTLVVHSETRLDVAHGDLVEIEGILNGAPTPRVSCAQVSRRHGGKAEVLDVARIRDRGIGASLALRARALDAVRTYFAKERFLEVETPSMVPSPGLDLHLDAFAIEGATPPRFLITSPEYQMKRLLTGGVPRCFQLARCFRRAELGGRHNPEFTMLEWYRAFGDMDAMVKDSEAIVRAVTQAIAPTGTLRFGDREVEISAPFFRISVAEAFVDIAKTSEEEMLRLANEDEETFFRILIEKIEPALAERPVPTVLHRYPASMASLARRSEDDPRYADRFEIYAGGLELSNGFVELTDATEQRERLERDVRDREKRGLPVYPIDERFLAALEGGMPPASGNALGFDRLVMLASARERISDVQAFPEGDL